MPIAEKNASQWLDTAIRYENEGKEKSASMALNAAIRADDKEWLNGGADASLPRFNTKRSD